MMFELFTIEEVNLMCVFDTSSRDALIAELRLCIPTIDEPEMTEIAESSLAKLNKMTGAEFAALELYPVYEDYDEQEV